MKVGFLLALALPAVCLAATADVPDGTFPVTLTLNVKLSGLSPTVARGAWYCAARAMPRRSIDVEIAKINVLMGRAAQSEYTAGLEYRAGYFKQQASSDFAIVNGGYTGTQAISISVTPTDLVNSKTGRAIADPGVMIGCWLRLYDASGKGGAAYQVLTGAARPNSADSMLQVTFAPYFLASASVPGE